VASNATPEGRALNRRVEVVIADERGTLRSR
jgi:outer membrane protein OmpA-like peptidoglycan-associated protein